MDHNPALDFILSLKDDPQRLKEIPSDSLEEIRQQHESFLAELEALAVEAIASANWIPVLEHLNEIMAWQDSQLHEAQKASTADMESPGADPLPTTAVNERKEQNSSCHTNLN
jgi:hypothetical protein